MLGWDRQQGNLDWHGRLHDKAFEGREMATTPGAGRTVAMNTMHDWPDPYDPVESYWSHDPKIPREPETPKRVGVKASVGGGRYAPLRALRFLLDLCYYAVCTVATILMALILVSLFAR